MSQVTYSKVLITHTIQALIIKAQKQGKKLSAELQRNSNVSISEKQHRSSITRLPSAMENKGSLKTVRD